MGCERRVVSAAVLSMEDERKIKRLRLKLGVLPVLANERKDILRRGLLWIRVAQKKRGSVMVVSLRLIGICGDCRDGAYEVDGLL
jgi:hypothetical protein